MIDPEPHEILVRAFTASEIVDGHAAFSADRLTDHLNAHAGIRVRDVSLLDLSTFERIEQPEFTLARSRLMVIHGQGPRGSARERFRTWSHDVTVIVGPYRIEGSIHSTPGGNPISGLYHRPIMVPITDAVMSYVVLGRIVEEAAEFVVINRELVTSIVLRRDILRAQTPPDSEEMSEALVPRTPRYLPHPGRRV